MIRPGSTLKTKVYGPSLIFLTITTFFPSIFLLVVFVHFVGTSDPRIFIVPGLYLLVGLLSLTSKVIIEEDSVRIFHWAWGRTCVIKWADITGLELWKTPLMGDVLRIKVGTKPQRVAGGIKGVFNKHHDIMREIAARAPKGIPVDPRLYSSELDRNMTLEMFVEGSVGFAFLLLLIFMWDKIEAATNMPPQDLRTKAIVCFLLILPMYWLVPKLWEKIKRR